MKYSLILFILIFSCAQKSKENKTSDDKIKSISISTYGGEMGYSQSIRMTADSLYFNFNLAADTTQRKHQVKKNNLYKLEAIISSSQLISFSKITNGKSRLPVDGADTQITIETKKNTYSIINGEGNKIWEKMKTALKGIINNEFSVE